MDNTTFSFLPFLHGRRAEFFFLCLLLFGRFALGQAPVITNVPNQLVTIFTLDGANGANPYVGEGLTQDLQGDLLGTTLSGGVKGYGTVFKISTTGTLVWSISLSGSNGRKPYSGVVPDSNGSFYGTAYYGGKDGIGEIYSVTSSGLLTRISSFTGTGSDGEWPRGGLLVASNGELYGGSENGGSNSNGTLYETTTSGPETAFFSFNDTDSGKFPHTSLIEGTDSYIYGTAFNGGTGGDGTIFKVTLSGSFTKLYDFSGPDGNGPRGLVQANDGNFYGMTDLGGGDDDGTLYQVTSSGSLATLVVFNGTNGSQPQSTLIQAADGNLYGVTSVGGANGDGTLFQATLSGSLTTLVTFNGTNGADPYGALYEGRDHNLYGTTVSGGNAGDGTVFCLMRSATATQLDGEFTYQILASNSPTAYGAAGLPAGLSMDSATGLISGTPSVNGTFTVTMSVANASGTESAPLLLTVLPEPLPEITSTAAATGTADYPFSYPTVAGYSPTSYSAMGLPAGLVMDPGTGLISGTPTVSGSFTATVYAANVSGSDSASLTILLAVPPAPVVSSTLTASGTGDFPFAYTIGGSSYPVSFDASGLPPGLTVNTSTGLISGTPTVDGTFTAVISVINLGGSNSADLSLVFAVPPAPEISSTLSATGTNGDLFQYAISAEDYPVSYTAMGLPQGLFLDDSTGLISGTPTMTGTFAASISAINLGGTDSETLNFNILPPRPSISGSAAATATLGQPFSYQIIASNNPTGYGATGLPSGLSVNGAGLISGTPAVNGTFAVTLSASNGGGSGSTPLMLTVNLTYPAVQGSYIGLGAVGGLNTAQVTLDVTSKGAFTGKLMLAGSEFPIKGAIPSSGILSGSLIEDHAVVAMQLFLDGSAPASFSGDISVASTSGSADYTVEGGLVGKFNTHTIPAGIAGHYTVILPVTSATESGLPNFPGYGTMTVSPTGAVTLAGVLGDGTAFAAGGPLHADGKTWTLFQRLYGTKKPGTIAGEITFQSEVGSDCNGPVYLIKPPRAEENYPGGFAISANFLGAAYHSPSFPTGTAAFTLGGGSLADDAITDSLTISGASKVVVSGSNDGDIAVTLTPGTGAMSGAFRYPVTNKKTSFGGVIYQKNGPAGFGLFMGGGQAGGIEITP